MFQAIPLKQDWHKPLPRYWSNDSAFATHFLNALSLVLPECEKFFIATTKPFLKHNLNADHHRDLLEFIKQEGYHRYAHIKYNDWLESQGLPVKALLKSTRRSWQIANKLLTPKQKLALTICIEHITVVYAAILLSNQQVFEQMHPHFREIWQFHAIEELEHKSVTMDLWNSIGGDEFTKRAFMTMALPLYIYYVAKHTLVFLYVDGQLFKWKTWKDALIFLFNKDTGLLRKSFIPWMDIFKKDFHPSDHDHSELLKISKFTVDTL